MSKLTITMHWPRIWPNSLNLSADVLRICVRLLQSSREWWPRVASALQKDIISCFCRVIQWQKLYDVRTFTSKHYPCCYSACCFVIWPHVMRVFQSLYTCCCFLVHCYAATVYELIVLRLFRLLRVFSHMLRRPIRTPRWLRLPSTPISWVAAVKTCTSSSRSVRLEAHSATVSDSTLRSSTVAQLTGFRCESDAYFCFDDVRRCFSVLMFYTMLHNILIIIVYYAKRQPQYNSIEHLSVVFCMYIQGGPKK